MDLRFLWQIPYTILALLTFALSVLIAFPFMVLISLPGTTGSRRLIWKIIRYWSKCWLWLIGMPLRISGPAPPPGKYVVVANHISYLDAILIFAAVPGYFRPLGKAEMSRIPFMGFIYRQIVLPVDRKSRQSRALSMRLMYHAVKKEGNVVVFPEGTFNETGRPMKEFYDGAFRLALNAGVPVLPLLFPDSEARWHYSGWWKSSPGRNRAVFMEPVPVAGMSITDLPELKSRIFGMMTAKMKELNPGKFND